VQQVGLQSSSDIRYLLKLTRLSNKRLIAYLRFLPTPADTDFELENLPVWHINFPPEANEKESRIP